MLITNAIVGDRRINQNIENQVATKQQKTKRNNFWRGLQKFGLAIENEWLSFDDLASFLATELNILILLT